LGPFIVRFSREFISLRLPARTPIASLSNPTHSSKFTSRFCEHCNFLKALFKLEIDLFVSCSSLRKNKLPTKIKVRSRKQLKFLNPLLKPTIPGSVTCNELKSYFKNWNLSEYMKDKWSFSRDLSVSSALPREHNDLLPTLGHDSMWIFKFFKPENLPMTRNRPHKILSFASSKLIKLTLRLLILYCVFRRSAI